jgi:hypothetical protein
MLTITTVVIMPNCRPASGNNSQELATTLFIVHSVQSGRKKLCAEVIFVCDLVSVLNPWKQFLVQHWILQPKIAGQIYFTL